MAFNCGVCAFCGVSAPEGVAFKEIPLTDKGIRRTFKHKHEAPNGAGYMNTTSETRFLCDGCIEKFYSMPLPLKRRSMKSRVSEEAPLLES